MRQIEVGFPVPAVQLGTSATSLYVCPANAQSARLNKITFTNTSGTNRTVTLYVKRGSETLSDKHLIVSAQNVVAGLSLVPTEVNGLILNAGDSLYALASAATAISPAGNILEVYAS